MSTPGSGGFEYTDDSVIARVSFDIPPSTVTDVSQITQVMGAMRTELESIARAQSDWLDYLGQVPAIAERANQAFRDQITLLERMSYLQSEVSSSSNFGMGGYGGYGGGYGTGGGGGAGGVPTYSTAAPAGYQAPFEEQQAGMGRNPNFNEVAEQIAEKAGGGDDGMRAAGEVMAARGLSLNPALLASIGGGIYGAIKGTGQQQQQQQQQQSGGGGFLGGVMSQLPPAVQAILSSAGGVGGKVWDEIKNTGMGTRINDILSNIPGFPGGGGGGGGGTPPGGGGASTPGAPGGGWRNQILNQAKKAWQDHPTAVIGAGLGAGALAFNKVQDIGERVTRLQELGSQEGGDYLTGLKEDLHARMIALDPFINTDQARKAISLPMNAGFQGSSRSELRDELITNFKELGMTMAQSMKMAVTDMRGVDLTDENVKASRTSRDATVNVLKEMAGDGGNTMALEERLQQLEQMKTGLNSLGVDQANIERSAIATQQGFDDSMALRGEGARITNQTVGSKNLMAMVGQRHGITGILPDAMPAALAEAGIDMDEARDEAAAEAAKAVKGLPNKLNRIAAFKGLMNENGVELDFPQAKDLYEKVSGDKSKWASQQGNRAVAAKAEKNTTNWNPLGVIKNLFTADSGEEIVDAVMSRSAPSQNADNTVNSFRNAGRLPSERGKPLPQSVNQLQTVTTSGNVSGEVRIVVDQQGRVSAPPVIQLSGQQKAVNAGSGSAQLNNAPPGDPLYNHAWNSFPGG